MTNQMVVIFNYGENEINLQENYKDCKTLIYNIQGDITNEERQGNTCEMVKKGIEEKQSGLNSRNMRLYFVHYINIQNINSGWFNWYVRFMTWIKKQVGSGIYQLHLTFFEYIYGSICEEKISSLKGTLTDFYDPQMHRTSLCSPHIQFLLFKRGIDTVSIPMQKTAITRLIEIILYKSSNANELYQTLKNDFCMICSNEYNETEYRELEKEKELINEWLEGKKDNYFAEVVMKEYKEIVMDEYFNHIKEIESWKSLYPISTGEYQKEKGLFKCRYKINDAKRKELIKKERGDYRKNYIKQLENGLKRRMLEKILDEKLTYREIEDVGNMIKRKEGKNLKDEIYTKCDTAGLLSLEEKNEFVTLLDGWIKSYYSNTESELDKQYEAKSERLQHIKMILEEKKFGSIDECITKIENMTCFSAPDGLSNIVGSWIKICVSGDIFAQRKSENKSVENLIELNSLKNKTVFCLKIGPGIPNVNEQIATDKIDGMLDSIFHCNM